MRCTPEWGSRIDGDVIHSAALNPGIPQIPATARYRRNFAIGTRPADPALDLPQMRPLPGPAQMLDQRRADRPTDLQTLR